MSNKGLTISPPPAERNLYRVIYVIDIEADSIPGAARKADKIMRDTNSIAPVLDVISQNGRVTRVDLSNG